MIQLCAQCGKKIDKGTMAHRWGKYYHYSPCYHDALCESYDRIAREYPSYSEVELKYLKEE